MNPDCTSGDGDGATEYLFGDENPKVVMDALSKMSPKTPVTFLTDNFSRTDEAPLGEMMAIFDGKMHEVFGDSSGLVMRPRTETRVATDKAIHKDFGSDICGYDGDNQVAA